MTLIEAPTAQLADLATAMDEAITLVLMDKRLDRMECLARLREIENLPSAAVNLRQKQMLLLEVALLRLAGVTAVG